jgi:hypothetical protein
MVQPGFSWRTRACEQIVCAIRRGHLAMKGESLYKISALMGNSPAARSAS